jgi:hypothetical protein
MQDMTEHTSKGEAFVNGSYHYRQYSYGFDSARGDSAEWGKTLSRRLRSVTENAHTPIHLMHLSPAPAQCASVTVPDDHYAKKKSSTSLRKRLQVRPCRCRQEKERPIFDFVFPSLLSHPHPCSQPILANIASKPNCMQMGKHFQKEIQYIQNLGYICIVLHVCDSLHVK